MGIHRFLLVLNMMVMYAKQRKEPKLIQVQHICIVHMQRMIVVIMQQCMDEVMEQVPDHVVIHINIMMAVKDIRVIM